INWGDGNSSAGTIQEVGPALFVVLGSHTYTAADMFLITVDISQGWNVQEKDIESRSAALIGALFNSPLAIQKMQFNNGITLRSDATGAQFGPQQWQAAGGRIGSPYAYVRGNTLGL
ncbi:MAG: hypothetical protein ACRD1Y_12425, partial [Terriglobales bacterium]